MCNCFIKLDNSQSELAIIGLRAKLVRTWDVTIGQKSEGRRNDLTEGYQDIFIAKKVSIFFHFSYMYICQPKNR